MSGLIDWEKLFFVCDLCGNTAPFRHGMETWSMKYDEPNPNDKRSFCSEICAHEIYLKEKGGKNVSTV